jgi:hypothetical protein
MGATRASYGLGHVPGRGRTPTIGNIKINVMSRQERFLKINYLKLKSACRNKLINIRLIRISP